MLTEEFMLGVCINVANNDGFLDQIDLNKLIEDLKHTPGVAVCSTCDCFFEIKDNPLQCSVCKLAEELGPDEED